MRMVMTMRRFSGVLALAGLGAVACADAQGDDEETRETVQGAQVETLTRVINVETMEVRPSSFADYIRITGEAEAFSDVTVSAEEGGVVSRFAVDKGQRMRRGDVIAEINADVMRAQVDEARASAALAREQYERQRRLWEDEGMGSEINFLQAKYQSEIAAARLATLESRLNKMAIRAPIDGVFDEKFVEVGEITMPGTAVARLVAVNRIKVVGGVPERFASSVRRGDEAIITFDILEGRKFEGTISFVGSSVEERSRTFPIEVVFRNLDLVIKPQMVANVQLVRRSLEGVVVVPQQLVIRSEEGYHVYVLDDRDGAQFALARPVTLGASYGGKVVVESGLDFGEDLITLGAQLVDNGSRVQVVRPRETGASGSGGSER